MSETRYPTEVLDPDWEDDGTMQSNVDELARHVVGHRIVKAERRGVATTSRWGHQETGDAFVITLDNGKQVALRDSSDCCAYTDLESFFLDPAGVDHVIMGAGTTDGFTTWHIYADWGDVLKMQVGWSCGNQFYYGYGFAIEVVEVA